MSEQAPENDALDHATLLAAANLVEGLRVHVDTDPHSTCEDGCGWFNYAALRLRERAALCVIPGLVMHAPVDEDEAPDA